MNTVEPPIKDTPKDHKPPYKAYNITYKKDNLSTVESFSADKGHSIPYTALYLEIRRKTDKPPRYKLSLPPSISPPQLATPTNTILVTYHVMNHMGQGPHHGGREERHAKQEEMKNGHREEPHQPRAPAVQPELLGVRLGNTWHLHFVLHTRQGQGSVEIMWAGQCR